ncbi:hypothetical protein [Flavobacterium sp.]|uniref:hypothetical protein n=1 Tax=Flavobacterium sp. TaxID=239 RepID=UPI002628BCC7|nr:hypothetical protein [Flavobacterium sp.]
MKVKLSLLIIIISIFETYSQTGRQVYGKIISNELAVQAVDIVNLNTKKSTTSDKNGNFTIEATVNEVLYFISEDYHDLKVKITHDNVNKNLIISLTKKPIEIEEVSIEKKTNFKGIAGYNDIKMAKIEKDATAPKVVGVYTGEIVNGMDFVQIGKSIWKLIKGKKKTPTTKQEEIDYQEFIETVFNEEFFIKTLQLKADQVQLFLEYCLADEKFLETISKKNKFEMMNALISKNDEFKKI